MPIFNLFFPVAASLSSFIIPTELDADKRIKRIMDLLVDKLQSVGITVEFTIKAGGSLTSGQKVVVPCIAASRLGSDIEAAFAASKVSSMYTLFTPTNYNSNTIIKPFYISLLNQFCDYLD